jgi:hypothetical protein
VKAKGRTKWKTNKHETKSSENRKEKKENSEQNYVTVCREARETIARDRSDKLGANL